MRLATILAGVWMACGAAACADDIYVNNVGGDDLYDGSSPTMQSGRVGPMRTLARALRVADRTDRVILAATDQPYRESLTLQAGAHSGSADRPFQIVGNGAILDGTAPVPDRGWEHVRGDLFSFSPPRMSYQILYLAGKPAQRVPTDRATLRMPSLAPLQWCLFERKIYFRVEPGRVPQDYALAYASLPVGITLYGVRNVVIRDLIVQGFQLDGVNVCDLVTDTRLNNVTCRGNARSGVAVAGASRVRIEDCLIGGNGAAQIRTEGFSHTYLVNCRLPETTAPAIVREGGEVVTEKPKGQ